MKSLYNKAFTDYGGQIGYAPAVATIAVGLTLCCGLIYGCVMLGKAAFAKPPGIASVVLVHRS
jgi:ABC-type sugar transport system permease subunit